MSRYAAARRIRRTMRFSRGPLTERGSIALDTVRRTAHQQLGRIEKVRGGGCYPVFVRQHEDDFVVRLHNVVVIVLRFRDHDGTLQIVARCFDPGGRFLHGALRRQERVGIPFQEVTRTGPRVNDHFCKGISGLEGKGWQHQVLCFSSQPRPILHLLVNGHGQILSDEARRYFTVPRHYAL